MIQLINQKLVSARSTLSVGQSTHYKIQHCSERIILDAQITAGKFATLIQVITQRTQSQTVE